MTEPRDPQQVQTGNRKRSQGHPDYRAPGLPVRRLLRLTTFFLFNFRSVFLLRFLTARFRSSIDGWIDALREDSAPVT